MNLVDVAFTGDSLAVGSSMHALAYSQLATLCLQFLSVYITLRSASAS